MTEQEMMRVWVEAWKRAGPELELIRLREVLLKAYLLKESLDRLWNYTYEGAALRLSQQLD